MSVVLPRSHGAEGVSLFRSALTAPFSAAMTSSPISMTNGSFAATGSYRQPVFLVRLRRALGAEAVVVKPSVNGETQRDVVFAPFSGEGTLLCAYRPQLQEGEDGTGAFTVDVDVCRVINETRHDHLPEVGAVLSNADAAELIEGVVLEGLMARVLYLATLEKQRVIRVSREMDACRYLELAYADGLDAIGRDVGVARRSDRDESDAEYRARLAIYTSWLLPTPAGFSEALNGAEALNGPEENGPANAGLLSKVGVTDRFEIVEDINELSVATKLVYAGVNGKKAWNNFHAEIQASHLVDLDKPLPKQLPDSRRERYEVIRKRLNNEVKRLDAKVRRLAPLTASTLDRAVRLMRALAYNGDIVLVRAYDSDGGSAYELGLSVDVKPFDAAALTAMSKRVNEVKGDAEIVALARSLTPRDPADDPLGAWLFEPCGFRTVHAVDKDRVLLSPLPSFGQWIDGDSEVKGQTTYEARYHASGTATGVHVRVSESLDEATSLFADNGYGALPNVLTSAQLTDTLQKLSAVAAPARPGILAESEAAGLVAHDAQVFSTSLRNNMNLDQVAALEIPKAAVEALAGGNGVKLRSALNDRTQALLEAGFYSTAGVWDDANARLLVFASVSQLPASVTKIGEAPTATYYWYSTPVPSMAPGQEKSIFLKQNRGGRATVANRSDGLSLLVCIGYARRGLADPFEVKIKLEDAGTILNAGQYAYLMNLLETLYPVGIEINTYDIRRYHVDSDGDGKPEFLTSRASRTYYRYRSRRPFSRGRSTRGSDQ